MEHHTLPNPRNCPMMKVMTKQTPAPPEPKTPVWADLEPNLPRLLRPLEPISLEEMAEAALLDRYETKYVFHRDRLAAALDDLADEYRVLEINDSPLNHYLTLYFDTPGFALYYRHHAGGLNRYKVRSRVYLDTGVSFIEVKRKINSYRTVKTRVGTAEFSDRISLETAGFLDMHLPAGEWQLEPKLWNQYTRVTLVGKRSPERVTLDLDLSFLTNDGQPALLPDLVIGEVKRGDAGRDSAFIRRMRAMSIRPTSFSKYCIGTAMLYEQVKRNRFLPTLRQVGKIMQE